MGNQGSFYQNFDFVTPTGLYKSKNRSSSTSSTITNQNWSVNEAKKLIIAKKIAPRFPGTSSEKLSMKYGIKRGVDTKSVWEECPICFRFYPEVNSSICCSQKICSECYLNMTNPSKTSDCPFCFTKNFTVIYLPSPHGIEAAIQEMIACMREDGTKNWELEDGETSENLDTASVDTMKELQKESVKQAYQAEADRARMSLANNNLSRKSLLENYIPDDMFSVSSAKFESPMMSPGRLEELMLLQAIEASLKIEEEEKRKNNMDTTTTAAKMLVSPMLYPTKQNHATSTNDSLTASTVSMSITSPLTFSQRNEISKFPSKLSDSLPILSLPPPKSSTSTKFQ